MTDAEFISKIEQQSANGFINVEQRKLSGNKLRAILVAAGSKNLRAIRIFVENPSEDMIELLMKSLEGSKNLRALAVPFGLFNFNSATILLTLTPSLEMLDINANGFSATILKRLIDSLADNGTLEVFSLRYGNISDADGCNLVKRASELKVCRFNAKNLSAETVTKFLEALPNDGTLESLHLIEGAINSQGFEPLFARAGTLKELDIYAKYLHADVVTNLIAALPSNGKLRNLSIRKRSINVDGAKAIVVRAKGLRILSIDAKNLDVDLMNKIIQTLPCDGSLIELTIPNAPMNADIECGIIERANNLDLLDIQGCVANPLDFPSLNNALWNMKLRNATVRCDFDILSPQEVLRQTTDRVLNGGDRRSADVAQMFKEYKPDFAKESVGEDSSDDEEDISDAEAEERLQDQSLGLALRKEFGDEVQVSSAEELRILRKLIDAFKDDEDSQIASIKELSKFSLDDIKALKSLASDCELVKFYYQKVSGNAMDPNDKKILVKAIEAVSDNDVAVKRFASIFASELFWGLVTCFELASCADFKMFKCEKEKLKDKTMKYGVKGAGYLAGLAIGTTVATYAVPVAPILTPAAIASASTLKAATTAAFAFGGRMVGEIIGYFLNDHFSEKRSKSVTDGFSALKRLENDLDIDFDRVPKVAREFCAKMAAAVTIHVFAPQKAYGSLEYKKERSREQKLQEKYLADKRCKYMTLITDAIAFRYVNCQEGMDRACVTAMFHAFCGKALTLRNPVGLKGKGWFGVSKTEMYEKRAESLIGYVYDLTEEGEVAPADPIQSLNLRLEAFEVRSNAQQELAERQRLEIDRLWKTIDVMNDFMKEMSSSHPKFLQYLIASQAAQEGRRRQRYS